MASIDTRYLLWVLGKAMSKVNLIAQVCMYNEVKKGNLDRCLDNLIRYCDRVIVYDDASTDNSVEIAERYGCHVIKGQVNNQMQELAHKQAMLEVALAMGATHLFWLDCDEVLDRTGTMGGLRQLCEDWPDGLDAYSFPEINLWRSQTWQRMDSLFTKARFVRLWKTAPGINFNVTEGVHKWLYPATIGVIEEAPFGVIHYGFWDYKRMLVKIGADHLDKAGFQSCAEYGLDGRGANWILDERKCSCQKLPDEIYPPGCLPPDVWDEPKPRVIKDLIPYSDIPESLPLPLMDRRALSDWDRLHDAGYHGDCWEIRDKIKAVMNKPKSVTTRASLFKFDPTGKTVVDLGCGGGWFMADCIKNGAAIVHGIEVNEGLLEMGRQAFQASGVDQDRYRFHNVLTMPRLSDIDIVYSVAVFMHLPFWQACKYFEWINRILAPNGEAHLQFYQQAGENRTMFRDGFVGAQHGGDHVTTVRLDNEFERAGLVIMDKRLAEGEGVLPVWQMYRLGKATKSSSGSQSE